MQEIFGDKVQFRPRTMTTSCVLCFERTKKQCILEGKYCPLLPSGLKATNFLEENNIKPENLIMQSLREQCVYDSLKDDFKSHWFKYMDLLTYDCIN
jgi:hypothetical protein